MLVNLGLGALPSWSLSCYSTVSEGSGLLLRRTSSKKANYSL